MNDKPAMANTQAFAVITQDELSSLRAELAELRRVIDEARAQKPVAVVNDHYSRDGVNDEISTFLAVDTELYTAPVPQPAAEKGSTHCYNCGCDWLDNGLNPVGCPYCKHDDNKFNPCLNSLVRQVWLMMDDCEEHADGSITIDCDISQGFLSRIYDLLNALEDAGYDPEDAILAAKENKP